MSPLSLDEISIEEKLQTMETLWDDLCKNANSVPVPDWHRTVLLDGEVALEQGSDTFVSWDEAKRLIKE